MLQQHRGTVKAPFLIRIELKETDIKVKLLIGSEKLSSDLCVHLLPFDLGESHAGEVHRV